MIKKNSKLKSKPLRIKLNQQSEAQTQAIQNVFGKLLGENTQLKKVLSNNEHTYAKMTSDAKITTAAILDNTPTPMASDVKMATYAKMAQPILIDDQKGETNIPNLILDRLPEILEPSAFLLYLRLYRLSYGFHKTTCTVGLKKLANSLNMGVRTIERSIKKLEIIGLIEKQGTNFGKGLKGNHYLVNLPNTHAKMTPVAKMTTMAKSTPDVILATNKDDYIKEHNNKSHHLKTRAHDTHAMGTMMTYESVTGNRWTTADEKIYEELKDIPMETIQLVIKSAYERALSPPRSLAYFKQEILFQASPQLSIPNKKKTKTALRKIAERIQNLMIGSDSSVSEIVDRIKQQAAEDGIPYGGGLIDEVLEDMRKKA